MDKTTYKILVVDDEPDLQPLVLQRMRRAIRSKQYKFEFASNGVEALEILKQDKTFDIVLADINMPRMDGITLLQQIPMADPDIRSVVVSAYGDMKNIRKAMNAGAFDFITKPIDFMDLRATIERTIGHIEMWKEIGSSEIHTSINNESGIASRMQMAILPRNFPAGRNYKLFGTVEPSSSISGDFYDVVVLENGLLGLAIADVSDKGLPAAMFMMSSRSLFKGAAIGARDPSGVLNEVNSRLIEGNDEGMFVTIFYCIFDPFTGKVEYANGGHCHPLVIHSDGTHDFLLSKGGGALGMADIIEFENRTVKLHPGDHLILYTDGAVMAENPSGEMFGEERLVGVVKDSMNDPEEGVDEKVVSAIQDFCGNRAPADDITCLVLRYDNPLF